MKITIAFLAIGATCFAAQRPAPAASNPKAIVAVPATPVPPSLILGVLGMAGCGILLARRRQASA